MDGLKAVPFKEFGFSATCPVVPFVRETVSAVCLAHPLKDQNVRWPGLAVGLEGRPVTTRRPGRALTLPRPAPIITAGPVIISVRVSSSHLLPDALAR